jgi:hypothetical protein
VQLEKEYQKEYASLGVPRKKAQGKMDFQKFRGEVKTSVGKEISSRRNAVDGFIATSGTSSAILMLQDISGAIPKTVKVDVTQFLFTGESGTPGGRLTLKAETDGYSSVEAIKESLKKISHISDMEEKQSGGKPGTDNKVIEFSLNMNYKTQGGGKKG